MKFFELTGDQITPVLDKAISQYGHAPEHNGYWYRYCGGIQGYHAPAQAKEKDVFVGWPDGSGLLTIEDRKVRYVFSEPLAPLTKKATILAEYLTRVLKIPEVKKVVLELETEVRQALLRSLPSHIRAVPINYTLTWPIMDLNQFDPGLPGRHFKYLRHARNKFYREHTVKVVDLNTVAKDGLYSLVDRWRGVRGGHDRADYRRYYNFIAAGAKGAESTRVFMVDGRAAGLNAGWPIPNSRRYYGAIGLHDYSFADLGLVLYLEDLEWIKSRGYSEADMGGGEKALTNFKKQFRPVSFYKTHVFSVVERS